jgi:hypothetical protein
MIQLVQNYWLVGVAYLLIGIAFGARKLYRSQKDVRRIHDFSRRPANPRAYSVHGEEQAGCAMAIIALIFFLSEVMYWPIVLCLRILGVTKSI